jgi:hypothetical protein
VPLTLATGAGAEMRQVLGTAMFYGMLGVTGFGLLYTPVFYVVVRRLFGGRKQPVLTDRAGGFAEGLAHAPAPGRSPAE